MSDEKIETFDEKRGVGILSGKPPTKWQGPRRRPPRYYAGETYGKRRLGRTRAKMLGRLINYPDVERHANGSLPAIRDKPARRLIRGALKRHYSKVEKSLKLPRAMLAQARLIAREEKKSAKWAKRLYARELTIHETVFAPSGKELRKIRTAKRKLKREGKKDAITQLVERMTK